MQRLLVMSCGKRKRLTVEPLPALERYDGPSFRVLRRYLATQPASPPDVYILSARFGLIAAADPIPYYDHLMTLQRAAELAPVAQATLAEVLRSGSGAYEQIYFALGREYWQALGGQEGYATLVPPDVHVVIARGAPGVRIARLHDWLYGPASSLDQRPSDSDSRSQRRRARGSPRFRGAELLLTKPRVLARARLALATDVHGSDRFQSWYVLIDEVRVAPKWLVSLATGLPASTFTTDDARRLLDRLGIDVYRA